MSIANLFDFLTATKVAAYSAATKKQALQNRCNFLEMRWR